MPAWLAAIPVIGQLFTSLGDAIDKNVTTDQERLQLKAQMMALQVPVVTAVIEAQKVANELQVRLTEAELKSEHWLVWSRRPVISYLAFANAIAANLAGAFGYNYMAQDDAWWLALLVNGLDFGSRGAEKVVGAFKAPERIK